LEECGGYEGKRCNSLAVPLPKALGITGLLPVELWQLDWLDIITISSKVTGGEGHFTADGRVIDWVGENDENTSAAGNQPGPM
jgi:hypothetical protein